ncbi:MAG: amidohydrolase family protein, partial [Xanthobacteraceae bacterium]
MQGKIALEEHFAIPETLEDSHGYFPEVVWQEVKARVLDIHDRRLREMDENGIELFLLSLNAPAVQAIPDKARAAEIARKANDYLAEQVQKRPDRFQGFAALAMQDPEIAARELERCVKELGFRGALVNGFSQVNDPDTILYYDLPQYRPFWATVERLDVPFYLHPRNPVPRDARIYDGHPWLMGPIWAFGQETAVHALRLMSSGLFDAYPRLNIVLGHMGENLPYGIWRVDNSNAWIPDRNKWPAKKRMGEYFSSNF